jgi:hypothetical protein
MDVAMTEYLRNAIDEHQRLVQRILAGGIPEGKDFDACRAVLQTDCSDEESFSALFTLLQGALADPFFGIDETQQVVPILKALARGNIVVKELV